MIRTVDEFLRAEGRFAELNSVGSAWRSLAVIVLVCGPLYGFAMGMFSVVPLQGLYSAVKVPMLLGVTSAICLPSFYVLHAVLGLRDDFGSACTAVLAAQAALAVALLGMTPILLFIYASTADYPAAVFANGVLFAGASLAGHTVMARQYRMLIARDARHVVTRRAWSVLYVFVAIQFAWVLRPFIGAPMVEPRFFREEAWSNAYVVVADLVWRMLS